MTVQEAAHFLGIKVGRLRSAVARKEIPFIKIGRLVRFQEDSLIAWIKSKLSDPS